MRALFIFPHPDDESYGPGRFMYCLQRQGHEVYLLTLTRGEATKQRFRLGAHKAEMGRIRYGEMLDVQKTLNIRQMDVWDFPDSGLKDMDPRELEKAIRAHLDKTDPDVIITYPVHGISGFYDHLVCHALVKRVFVEWREERDRPKRLAFFGPTEEQAAQSTWFPLKGLKEDDIDCVVTVEAGDIEANKRALDCYKSYKETNDNSGIKDMLSPEMSFEFFGESHDPPLNDIFGKM